LLGVLDANLPTGWKRLSGKDLLPFQALVRPGSAWYASGTMPSHVGVSLSLERLGESELRGGRVWFAGPPDPTPTSGIPPAWDHVMRFLDNGVIPAARSVGAEVRLPTPEEVFLSELPADVRDRLRSFSQVARKSLPLDREEADLWRGFVIAAFRATAVIDARQFTNWLVAEGWSRESAAELNLRFFDHCQLLSRYADEVSAA
jgi:hypothetical protein